MLGDLLGGLTAMLVAVPSAIAYGLLIYAPLGGAWSGTAAFSGLVGTVVLAAMAAAFGGSPRLISAPCAPAAAVLSVFVASMVAEGVDPALVPLYLGLTAAGAGVLQFAVGKAGGGKIIKYIPYPVVAGYLSGVGVLILLAQIPKVLGTPKDLDFLGSLVAVDKWQFPSLLVGGLTVAVMAGASRLTKAVPAAVLALAAGMAGYFALGFAFPQLFSLEHNKLVVGPIPPADAAYFGRLADSWMGLGRLASAGWERLVTPVLTLAALLSIDTLKTCVVVDVLTKARHDSNKTLVGQGLGNVLAGLFQAVPGAGTMGATMVNLNSGGKTKRSGVVAGLSALLVILLLGPAVAWIPVSCLAGILLVLAVRMIDAHSLQLWKHKSTRFDFVVILGVVAAAVTTSLIVAAGVGIALAIVLFLREQMRNAVIRRKIAGNRIFSKRTRPSNEVALLEAHGDETLVFELQGQLFFGTTDKLFTEVFPFLKTCRHLMLDMRRVQSVDYTAAHLLGQIKDQLRSSGGILVLVSVPRSLPTGANPLHYLKNLGVTDDGESLRFFPDLDAALEWAEDRVIARYRTDSAELDKPLSLAQFDLFSGFSAEALERLSTWAERRSVPAGQPIFHKDDRDRDLYLLRKGAVRIDLPLPDGASYHLATFDRGAFFGDMAFLDDEARSADAKAEGDVELFVLSREKFDALSADFPGVAVHFLERLSVVLSNRLRQSHAELKALQEG
jgi:SulP family sulfate permease